MFLKKNEEIMATQEQLQKEHLKKCYELQKQNIESKFQKTFNQITSVFFSQIEKRKKT